MRALNSDSEKVTNFIFILALVACVLALSYLREPLFFLQPRIWAEEGTVHIQSVLKNGIFTSLIQPHLGYYSFFNNYAVGFGIALFGIEKIAYVTTALSTVVMLATVLSPLILKSEYWNTKLKKSLIILFALTAGSGEIWVNTINAQFYFGLFTCFLLLSDTERLDGFRRLYVFIMLLQGAMTGVTSVIFFPFFLWKYFKQKEISHFEKLIVFILFFGLIVQLVSLFYLSLNSGLGRFSLNNLSNFPYGVFANLTSFIPIRSAWARLFLLVAISVIVLHQRVRIDLTSPSVMAVYASVLFAFLALSMSGGGRYAYIPSVLGFVFLLSLPPLKYKSLNIIYVCIIIFILINTCSNFFRTGGFYNSTWVPYDIKHAYQYNSDRLRIMLFPQWENTNWVIEVPMEVYERYK